jgi:predicted carbohydrate-binding protein with CBM5 and CBM33 domain
MSVTRAQGLGAPPSERTGYHVIDRSDGGVSYWPVSDVGIGELQNFVKLFRAAPTDG